MKNILAENLLRFGVKNLSESDIKKLQETNPAPKTAAKPAAAAKPGVKPTKTTTAAPAAKKPSSTVTLSTSCKLSFTTEGKADSILTFSVPIYKDDKTGKLSAGNVLARDTTKKINANFYLDGTVLKLGQSADMEMGEGIWVQQVQTNFDGYTGPGISPMQAVQSIAAQMSGKLGIQVTIDNDITEAFDEYYFPNQYSITKTAKIPSGAPIKAGIEYGVRINLPVDGKGEPGRLLYISDGGYSMAKGQKYYVGILDKAGNLQQGDKAGGLSYLAKGLARNTKMNNTSDPYYAVDEIKKYIATKLPYRNLISK
jgi:hypothetical protein